MLFAPQILIATFAVVVAEAFFFLVVPASLRAIGVRTYQGVTDFLFGFLLASFLGALIFIASVFTGGGQYFSGSMAERWTGKELAGLGPSWRVFHGVPFSYGFGPKSYVVDIDHIAVGPYGVLVIETKYLSMLLDLNDTQFPKRIRDAISQVEDNAGRVRALLGRDFPGVPVRPVVIVWGRLVTVPKDSVRNVEGRIESIRIVHGADAERWRPLLDVKEGYGVPPEMVELVSTKIESYVLEQERSLNSWPGH
jgi:hypothetical protein